MKVKEFKKKDIENLVFHEFSCLFCSSQVFRVVILRIDKGEYALGWICSTCGQNQPAIALEGMEQIKALIKIDVTKSLGTYEKNEDEE